MDRTIVAEGEAHVISCALIADGSSPAAEVFLQMGNGSWIEDPDVSDLPDDAQIHDYDFFLESLQYFADNGVPHSPVVGMNSLNDGVWEFKIRRKRFSFFDTDGFGTKFYPQKFKDRESSDYPEDDYFWHVPCFEEVIRIGHCFPKLRARTTDQQIRRTLQVRWEDLEHDRKEAQFGRATTVNP